MRVIRSQNDPKRMVITTSQYFEHQSYGQTILKEKSILWTLQSVWHCSNSAGLWKLESITIIFWTCAPISQLQENSRSKIGMIWMLSRSPKGQWCDYCGYRWGKDNWKGQTQAVWQITSKRGKKIVVRHYCHSCAMEAQTWHDGTLWTFKEQIDYAKGVQKLDVQLN